MKTETKELFKGLAFSLTWTAAVVSIAWFGLNRLDAASETGRFEYLWHEIGEQNWPTLFIGLQVFLKAMIGVSLLMALLGIAVISALIVKIVGLFFRNVPGETE